MAGVTASGGGPVGTDGGPREVGPRWRPLDHLVHFLLPSPCLGCGEPLSAARSPLGLCALCRVALRPAPSAACDACGRSLAAAAAPAGYRCGGCRARPPAFRRLVAPWSFAPPLDAVVRGLKFGRLDYLGGGLAAAIVEGLAVADGAEVASCDLVVPVPLHWRRRLARGFNQAERIASPLARRLGLPAVEALVRRRATPPQTSLGRAERRRNVGGAFAVRRPDAVAGRAVLLVDDVATTGATLDAGARCLLAAGAAAVVAVAAARRPANGD